MKNHVYRLTRVEAEKLFIAEHKRRGMTVIPSLLHTVTGGVGEWLLSTGAKLYRNPNGGPKPFMVIGYHYADEDAIKALEGILN